VTHAPGDLADRETQGSLPASLNWAEPGGSAGRVADYERCITAPAVLAAAGANPTLQGLQRGMRPDAYLIVAAGQRLYAPTLAEIAECAIVAGDRIELLRARTASGWRPLGHDESQGFSRLLASRLD
jgi:hypothetical protein